MLRLPLRQRGQRHHELRRRSPALHLTRPHRRASRRATMPHYLRHASHVPRTDDQHGAGRSSASTNRAELSKLSKLGTAPQDKRWFVMWLACVLLCGVLKCGLQSLVLTTYLGLTQPSTANWRRCRGHYGGWPPTGQQAGQAGQHRTDRTGRTDGRTAETVLSLALAVPRFALRVSARASAYSAF